MHAWGLAFILVGFIYALTPRTLTKSLMVLLMILTNAAFVAALWVLSGESPAYPLYWDYLYYVEWVFFPPWLIINVAGGYYLLRTKKKSEE